MSKSTFHKLLDISKASQERHSRGDANTSTIVCTVGEPGIGKTHGVKEWAKSIGYYLETIILGRIPSVDVGGVYIPEHESGRLKHYITDRLIGGNIPDGAKGIVVFFDELASAQEDQQVAIQAILEDRYLEGNHVPEHVIFVAATNLPEHTGGANDLVNSLRSRLLFFNHVFSSDEWLLKARTEWAVEPEIYQYHQWSDGAHLHRPAPDSDELCTPDPRGWMKVDEGFKGAKEQFGYESVYQLFKEDDLLALGIIDGVLGKGQSAEFWGFIKCNGELPSVDEVILSPQTAGLPGEPNSQYGIIYNLVYYCSTRAEKDELTKRDVNSTLEYLRRMPRPMAALGFRLLSQVEKFTQQSSEWAKFRTEYSDVLEA